MLFLYIFQPWFFSSNMLLYAIFHISNTVWTLMSSWLHTHVIQPTHARSALVAMPAFLSAAENGPIFMLASFAYLVPPAWNCLLVVGMTAKRPTPFPFLCAHTLPRPLKYRPHCEYGHSSLAQFGCSLHSRWEFALTERPIPVYWTKYLVNPLPVFHLSLPWVTAWLVYLSPCV